MNKKKGFSRIRNSILIAYYVVITVIGTILFFEKRQHINSNYEKELGIFNKDLESYNELEYRLQPLTESEKRMLQNPPQEPVCDRNKFMLSLEEMSVTPKEPNGISLLMNSNYINEEVRINSKYQKEYDTYLIQSKDYEKIKDKLKGLRGFDLLFSLIPPQKPIKQSILSNISFNGILLFMFFLILIPFGIWLVFQLGFYIARGYTSKD